MRSRRPISPGRKCRIVCTIGPASSDPETLASLITGGMDAARLNFSHGSREFHAGLIRQIRSAARQAGRPVAILQDLQGIKLRLGPMKGGGVELRQGSSVRIRLGDGVGDEKFLYVSYPLLLKDVRPGSRLLLDDGLLELRITGRQRDALLARVVEGGIVRDRKGVNLPGTAISMHPFTPKDRRDLEFGMAAGVDYVALSFVRSASDVVAVKEWMRRRGASIPVIAKIEKPEALEAIDDVISVSDGIMIARGDLGVEVSPEQVPLIQKLLIEKANRQGRTVITATQMLESMREHLRPTRAEAADVANAVIDGSDALMLSAETASGRYPVESLAMMDRIISYTEAGRAAAGVYEGGATYADALADGACRAARDISAKALVAYTRSGFTARLLSKQRPGIQVIAFTPDKAVMNRLSLLWGVRPMLLRPAPSIDSLVSAVERSLLRSGIAETGDSIVITAGSPLPGRAQTNFMKLHEIGSGR